MPTVSFFVENGFYIIESIGIASFAVSGIILARQKDFDLVGMYIIACVTAFGGGTLRDLILDRTPVYWISHSEYPLFILLLATFFYIFPKIGIKEKWLTIPDALGIALFTISSSQIAMEVNLSPTLVAIFATMSATFGGLIRDVSCHEIPMVYRKSSLYASVAFVGSVFYMCLLALNLEMGIASILSIIFTFFLRIIAIYFNWRL
ncbi:trimeric intracellular cation channel family protein [bacterium]|jgi:uncharacterized membrane protein YeiH|nr:trimeric intracellular cation channel family protein [bacterium]